MRSASRAQLSTCLSMIFAFSLFLRIWSLRPSASRVPSGVGLFFGLSSESGSKIKFASSISELDVLADDAPSHWGESWSLSRSCSCSCSCS